MEGGAKEAIASFVDAQLYRERSRDKGKNVGDDENDQEDSDSIIDDDGRPWQTSISIENAIGRC